MLLIGLTGGIGSGKSTVAGHLAARGAVVLDADELAREVVAPGTRALKQVQERFGAAVVDARGALDRPALGALVFDDPPARRDLEAITHPLIRQRTQERLAALPADALVVHDVPLLVELGYAPRYHLVLVVGADEQVRVDRLTGSRGLTRADALSRIRSQADDAARREVADAWLDNNGPPEALRDQVDSLHRSRLLPLHRNLEEGAPADPGNPVVATTGEDVTGRPRRILARLRWILGDAVVSARGAGPGGGQTGPADRTEVVLGIADPDAVDVRRRLCQGGFAPQVQRLYASCDPGRPATVQLQAPSVGGEG